MGVLPDFAAKVEAAQVLWTPKILVFIQAVSKTFFTQRLMVYWFTGLKGLQ